MSEFWATQANDIEIPHQDFALDSIQRLTSHKPSGPENPDDISGECTLYMLDRVNLIWP